jgi:hypothetical protein
MFECAMVPEVRLCITITSFVKSALVKGSFKTITALPKYVDLNEWVAINSESFFVVDYIVMM